MKKAILLALLMPCLAYGSMNDGMHAGNPGAPAEPIQELSPVKASPGDVIITEIMADPTPVVSLPDQEYFELMNRASYPVSLRNWKLIAGTQTITFPEFIIQPDGYVIVCSPSDTTLFRDFGRTLGLKSFPALTDGGKLLCLTDDEGTLIHGVEYSSGWYSDALKSGGGWSLEMIDKDYPFSGGSNWSVSVSRNGGTPGQPNSVRGSNPDNFFYGIVNVFPEDSVTIRVGFSETAVIGPGGIGSFSIGDAGLVSVYPDDPLLRNYYLIPEKPLVPGTLYTLMITSGVNDPAGNSMVNSSFDFGLTCETENGDIVFNELLFNPLPGDPDYIELFNSSGKVIDASGLLLASVNDATGATSSSVTLSATARCILPGTFYAVTTDRQKVIFRYFSSVPERIFETGSLPSMTDREGHLLLMNKSLERIDEVSYTEKMHFPLLSGVEGISLEKIRPESPSHDKGNWHSASEASGWGTPGAVNSVFTEEPVSSDNIVLSSTRITPDNDGYEDLLVIDMRLKGNGNVVSVTVFDEAGSFVRRLAENMLAGPEAAIVWDGTADGGSPVRNGIYILLITVFDDKGKTSRWKKVCSVIR
ncbi:MAG: lamin tail domain-containing protein [Bacteroidales bacterium]